MAIKDVFHVNVNCTGAEPVGKAGGARFCCFKGPDGTILELIDFSGAGR